MRFIRFCIDRPVTTWMIMLLAVMLGILSINSMKVELLPDISVPTLVVVTKMIKASPEEIEDKITLPVEDAVNGIAGLKMLTSRSREGLSQVRLEFTWGTDLDLVAMEVKEKLRGLELPAGVNHPYIWRWDPSMQPIFRCDIYGIDLDKLKELAENEIKPRLERIRGVGSVTVLGGREKEFRVTVSRARLKAANVSILEIVECLRRENINASVGKLESGRYEYLVRVMGKAADEKRLGEIVLTGAFGADVLLGDVARITPALKKANTRARIDGKPSIGLSVRKTSEGNAVKVIEKLEKEIDGLREARLIPEKVTVEVSRNDSEYILQSQKVVISNILQGCILAVCLVIFFIRNIRGAILLGISIPCSIVAAFGLLQIWGQSRNILVLGGMALAAGMVLDSSVVIVENIYRHIEEGRSVSRAAWEGTSEVAMGVVASALTTVLAFLPLLFIPGIIREIFRSLSLSIIAATVFACLIGLLFMPMMAARIFTPPPKSRNKLSKVTLATLERLDKIMESVLERILSYCISGFARRVTLLLLLIFLACCGILSLPGRGFLPSGKIRELQIELPAPSGASLDYMDKKAKEVERTLKNYSMELPGKTAHLETIATEIKKERALLSAQVKFTSTGENGYSRQNLFAVLADLRVKLQDDGELPVRVTTVNKVNPRSDVPLRLVIFPKNPQKWSPEKVRSYVKERVLPSLEKTAGTIYMQIAREKPVPELDILLNKDAIYRHGLTPDVVSYSVRCFIAGATATYLDTNGKQVPVNVRGEENERVSPDIGKIPIMNVVGKWIDLDETGDIYYKHGKACIERIDKKTALVVESNRIPYNAGGKTLGDIIDHVDSTLAQKDFPRGAQSFSHSFLYRYQGQAKDLNESSQNATIAFLISIALIYLVLCCQFESWLDPLVIMITVPLSFPGVALMLRLSGEEYSLGAMVGMICLGGIVVNNGIILIEFTNILRRRGLDLKQALLSASKRKLRSILITSLTSLLAMLPIILGIGEGSELYRGCCAVIFGGLLVSTPLTLIGIPVIYMFFEDIKETVSLHLLFLWLKLSKNSGKN